MKNIIIKSFAILAAVLLTSCVEETFPKGSTLTQEQVENSEFALQYMANGIPAAMMTSGTAGYASGYSYHGDFGIAAIHLSTESMLEDLAPLGELGYFWFGGYLQNTAMGPDYIYCAYFWECYYSWIKLANDIIRNIGEVSEETDAETLKYLGQAYAYRASFYLDLARLYEPKTNGYTDVSAVLGLTVPIVTEKTTEEMAKNNPRATREDIYEFILSDLALAEKYLANVPASYTEPSLYMIYGLYARLYLELGTTNSSYYADAAEYARLVIDKSGKSPLTEAQWHDPSNGFNNGSSNNSWIWGQTLDVENASNIITNIAHIATEANWGYSILSQVGISKALYEQIDNDDFRKLSYLDPEMTWLTDNHEYKFAGSASDQDNYLRGSIYNYAAVPYESIKFRPANGECSDYTIGNCADHVLMRIEEMYFIEIEATLFSKGLSDAQKLLNDFMKTYRYSSYDCSKLTGSQDSFLKEMLLQKRIEFWGEGILIFDYKRLDMGITRGYKNTNFPGVARFNTTGRSPQWNFVITRGEYQSNNGISIATNNPDPTETIELWSE